MPTPALVQSASNPGSSAGAGTLAEAFSSNNTSGNLLVCLVSSVSGTGVTYTCSDPTNGSWTQCSAAYEAENINCTAFYFVNCAGGVSPTVTVDSIPNVTYLNITIVELSGCAASSPLDSGSPGENSGTSATPSCAITTANPSDIILGIFEGYGSFTADQTLIASSATTKYLVEYQLVSTAGTHTFSPTGGGSNWAGYMVAFKAASGATTLNSTWTSNPKNALTLGDQVIRHVATLINPKATLTLTDQALRYIATLIGPKSTLTMNKQVLADVVLSIGPKATLTLTDQVLRKLTTAINPKATLSLNDQVLRDVTIAINPHSTLTLNDRVIRNVTLTVSPKVTLTLNAQISGSVTYLDATWFSGPAATLIMANIALADVALSIHAKSALTLTDLLALNSAISINPKAQLALSTQQLNQAQIVINPKVTLVLRGQISGQTSTQLYIFSDHFGVHRVVSSE